MGRASSRNICVPLFLSTSPSGLSSTDCSVPTCPGAPSPPTSHLQSWLWLLLWWMHQRTLCPGPPMQSPAQRRRCCCWSQTVLLLPQPDPPLLPGWAVTGLLQQYINIPGHLKIPFLLQHPFGLAASSSTQHNPRAGSAPSPSCSHQLSTVYPFLQL